MIRIRSHPLMARVFRIYMGSDRDGIYGTSQSSNFTFGLLSFAFLAFSCAFLMPVDPSHSIFQILPHAFVSLSTVHVLLASPPQD